MSEHKSEASQVLYRKYRPQSFKEVLGQEAVVEALEGAIKLGNISHAYLFAGSRGTGKTSVARIFAKAIGTSPNDLYEMDAASNNGVDEVRLLNEGVRTLPFESKYKVYILDEAHMLSKSAFNAFLKTLEEPPAHVVFILATTEFEKIPETVLSRCQSFTFRKPSQKILKEVVERIAKKEGFSIDAPSAELIALLSEGSFRDAQGMLQRVIASSEDTKISIAEVERATGSPKGSLINEVIVAIHEKSAAKGLGAVSKAVEQNIDMKIFAMLLLAKLRFILLLRNAPEMASVIKSEVSTEDFSFLKTEAARTGSAINSSVLLEFLTSYDLIGFAEIPELSLELSIIKLCGGA